MAVKKDDMMRRVFFLEDGILTPCISQVIEAAGDNNETLQLQLCIKGYDNRKDPKMTKDIVFPYRMRRDHGIIVVGNDTIRAKAESLSLPFYNAADFQGAENDEKRVRLIRQSKYIILGPEYQKGFNLRDILRRRRTHFMCPDPAKLDTLYEDLLHTYRLKIRDWFSISFPVGDCKMPVEEIVANVKHGVQFLADNLKKGPQNIKDCFVKRTLGTPVRIN